MTRFEFAKGRLACLLAVACLCLTAGCAKRVNLNVQEVPVDEIARVQMAENQEQGDNPNQHALPEIGATQRIIFPGDHLDILVYEKLPANDEKRIEKKKVDKDGQIHILPVGRLVVSGLTVAEVEKEIEQRLSQYVVSPYCEVEVVKSERRLFVFGEVQRPGTQELKPGYTILDALAQAGITEKAYSWDLKILRSRGGRVQIVSVDLKEIFKRGAIHHNLRLENNDIVFVPRRLLKNVADVLSELSSVTNTAVLFYALGTRF